MEVFVPLLNVLLFFASISLIGIFFPTKVFGSTVLAGADECTSAFALNVVGFEHSLLDIFPLYGLFTDSLSNFGFLD